MENSVNDISDIYKQFGTAEEVAEAYLAELSSLDLTERLRRLNIFRICTSLVILALVCFFILFIRELLQGYGVGAKIIIEESITE